MIRILVLEKDETEARRISSSLSDIHTETLTAEDMPAAAALLDDYHIDLIVAGGESGGIDLTNALRDSNDTTPVIILTEDASPREKRRIFRCGADGYMIIPIDLEELRMRVKSLLWRCRIVEESSLRFGSCILHSQTLTVEYPDGEIELKRLEFLLLEKLLSYPGRIFTRAQLMDELWGYDSTSNHRTVDTHIRRLRKKLCEIEDIRIQTIRGLGYRASMPRRLRRAEAERRKGPEERAAEK